MSTDDPIRRTARPEGVEPVNPIAGYVVIQKSPRFQANDVFTHQDGRLYTEAEARESAAADNEYTDGFISVVAEVREV
jgi:hypothetical protein